MKKPDYVYVSYIATTPEKLWQALHDVDLMREWWVDPKAGCARVNVSDWQPGSRWEHTRVDGSGIVDIVGKVVEDTAPRRLEFTWARPEEVDDESKHSRVVFDIEPYAERTRPPDRHPRRPGARPEDVRGRVGRLADGAVQPQNLPGDRTRVATFGSGGLIRPDRHGVAVPVMPACGKAVKPSRHHAITPP